MTEPAYVITVQRKRLPQFLGLTVFSVVVETPKETWEEIWGDVSLAQAHLKGLETILRSEGYFAHLSWDIPSSYSRPTGIRWTLVSKGVLTKQENLDADGSVIEDP